jgi:hypothetical protein
VNDPFPGFCGLYIDTNGNKVCDHSEAAFAPAVTLKPDLTLLFWPIFLPLVLYFVHWYLVYQTEAGRKIKWLGSFYFRYIWNLILLIAFLIVAISGMLMAFGVSNRSLTLWHDQIGVVFVIVGFIHFLVRISHFRLPER